MTGALGLTEDEETVYRAMLENPRLGVAGLVELLGWPETRITTVLDGLARLSLVRESLEKPGQQRLVHPEIALNYLLLRHEAELIEHARRVSSTRLVVAQLLVDHGERESVVAPSDAVRVMGRDAIQSRIEKLAAACQTEVVVFAPGGAQPAQSLEVAKPLDSALLSRGVDIRYVYLDSIRNDRATTRYAHWLIEQGAQVRTIPQLPPRMIIYDRRLAVVPVDPDVADLGAVVLSGIAVVASLYALFEQVWAQASQIGEVPRHQHEDLTDQEHALLLLLTQGHTDDVVARRLGVSVRTSRRLTSRLLDRLGARSRFQAGALAAERGWIPGVTPTAVLDGVFATGSRV
ncbi:hypothetical protein DMC61_21820 [Amycolatopsis sp. WAC 04169]|uniref:helix-turn-helix transcriptional regulator n=1 Tax=Amycolatopsis sp. WAC 04169 TaxID=2203197 RepID=UPI000F796D88|nr:helix-turn-helix domain-containing protein [Amycolatopsis sp. WAC 04169]RSN29144.1 hypothetical protein DMC61_21820 [Amycolatopsis sp. WAC 04169]